MPGRGLVRPRRRTNPLPSSPFRFPTSSSLHPPGTPSPGGPSALPAPVRVFHVGSKKQLPTVWLLLPTWRARLPSERNTLPAVWARRDAGRALLPTNLFLLTPEFIFPDRRTIFHVVCCFLLPT